MESVLVFEEEQRGLERQDISSSSSSYGLKQVPWMSWDEWLFVYDSLFSDSQDFLASAFRRVTQILNSFLPMLYNYITMLCTYVYVNRDTGTRFLAKRMKSEHKTSKNENSFEFELRREVQPGKFAILKKKQFPQ